MAEELGVGGRVHFTGAVDRAEDYYAAADILVLPTRSDPWEFGGDRGDGRRAAGRHDRGGRLLLVAAAAGAALLVPARSPERLASALGELLGDPSRRREMGARGQAEAGRFDVSSVVEATLGVYERALAEKSA